MQNIKGTVFRVSESDNSVMFRLKGVEITAIDTETGKKLFGPVYSDEQGRYELQTNFENKIASMIAKYSVVAKSTGQGCFGTVVKPNRGPATPPQTGTIAVNADSFTILFQPDNCLSELPSNKPEVSQIKNEKNTSKINKALILVVLGVLGYFGGITLYKKLKK